MKDPCPGLVCLHGPGWRTKAAGLACSCNGCGDCSNRLQLLRNLQYRSSSVVAGERVLSVGCGWSDIVQHSLIQHIARAEQVGGTNILLFSGKKETL